MLSISMREVGVSGRADADVLTRMSRATRAGCSSARSSAIRPPMEIPSTVACDMPTDSMSAAVSAAIIGIVYGASGLSVRPAPRLSKASTWLVCAHQSVSHPHCEISLASPPMITSGSPDPCSS